MPAETGLKIKPIIDPSEQTPAKQESQLEDKSSPNGSKPDSNAPRAVLALSSKEDNPEVKSEETIEGSKDSKPEVKSEDKQSPEVPESKAESDKSKICDSIVKSEGCSEKGVTLGLKTSNEKSEKGKPETLPEQLVTESETKRPESGSISEFTVGSDKSGSKSSDSREIVEGPDSESRLDKVSNGKFKDTEKISVVSAKGTTEKDEKSSEKSKGSDPQKNDLSQSAIPSTKVSGLSNTSDSTAKPGSESEKSESTKTSTNSEKSAIATESLKAKQTLSNVKTDDKLVGETLKSSEKTGSMPQNNLKPTGISSFQGEGKSETSTKQPPVLGSETLPIDPSVKKPASSPAPEKSDPTAKPNSAKEKSESSKHTLIKPDGDLSKAHSPPIKNLSSSPVPEKSELTTKSSSGNEKSYTSFQAPINVSSKPQPSEPSSAIKHSISSVVTQQQPPKPKHSIESMLGNTSSSRKVEEKEAAPPEKKPRLLGEEFNPVVSETIVEKAKVVQGSGSGADCNTGNYGGAENGRGEMKSGTDCEVRITESSSSKVDSDANPEENSNSHPDASGICGEEVTEEVVFFTGRGSGAECNTGNFRRNNQECDNSFEGKSNADSQSADSGGILGEAVTESIMYVTGRGSGVECLAKNSRKKRSNGVATNGTKAKSNGHNTSGDLEDDIPAVTVKGSAGKKSTKKKKVAENSDQDDESDNEEESEIELSNDEEENQSPVKSKKTSQNNSKTKHEATANEDQNSDEEKASLGKRKQNGNNKEEEEKEKESEKQDEEVTTPPPKKRRKREPFPKAIIEEVDEEEDGGRRSSRRSSGRLAMLRIKEAEKRQREEEEALERYKEKLARKAKRDAKSKEKYRKLGMEYEKERGRGKKGRKKREESSGEEFQDPEDDGEEGDDGKKKRRRKKKKKKNARDGQHLKEFEKFSSGSETGDEEVTSGEVTGDEDLIPAAKGRGKADDDIFRSDHEFSCESDVPDEEAQPVKHARTAGKKRGRKPRKKKEEERKEESSSEEEEQDDGFACAKCGTKDNPEWILLCDKCDAGWHASCLRPSLMTIPEGEWFCPNCSHLQLIEQVNS